MSFKLHVDVWSESGASLFSLPLVSRSVILAQPKWHNCRCPGTWLIMGPSYQVGASSVFIQADEESEELLLFLALYCRKRKENYTDDPLFNREYSVVLLNCRNPPPHTCKASECVSVESVAAGSEWHVFCCSSSDRKSMFSPQKPYHNGLPPINSSFINAQRYIWGFFFLGGGGSSWARWVLPS